MPSEVTEAAQPAGTAGRRADRRWWSWLRFDPGDPVVTAAGGADSGAATRAVPGWQRLVGAVLVGLGAVELAVFECFLVPLRAGSTQLPVAVVLAVVGNVALTRLMWRACRHRGVAAVPVVVWLVLVLVLAAKRQEGDLVVPGTGTGLAFLLLGTVAGAFALGQVIAPGARR